MIYNLSIKCFKNIFIIILGLVLVFLLTGCDVSYTIGLSDSGNIEEVKLVEYGNNDSDDSMDMYMDYLENYDEFNLPLSFKDGALLEKESKKNGVSYYEISKLDDYIGLQFDGHFNKNENVYSSNFVNYAIKTGDIKEDDLSIKINASLDKLFEKIPRLNSVEINMDTLNYKVIDNNADEVNGNFYKWLVTKENYKNKTIKIEINKMGSGFNANKIISYTGGKVRGTFDKISNKEIIIVCILIVFTFLVVRGVIRRKKKRINDF